MIAFIFFAALPADLPDQTAVPVGYVRGAADVAASGAFTYSVAIKSPPGRGGVQPSLSVSYSSNQSMGELGLGFALNGLSSVKRCRENYASDASIGWYEDEYAGGNKLCLDGQRLAQVAMTGTTIEYRTVPDSFVKVIGYDHSYGQFSRFEAWLPNGSIIELGEHVRQTTGVTAEWKQSRLRDRYGNYMQVIYDHLPVVAPFLPGQDSEVLPRFIRYTGYDPALAVPSTSGTALIGEKEIEIVWNQTASPQMSGFSGQRRWERTKLISDLMLRVNGKLHKRYSFTYRTSAGSQRSLLHTLRECDGANTCLPEVRFEYTSPGVATDFAQPLFFADASSDTAPVNQATVMATDLDGNGIADLVYESHRNGKTHIAFRLGSTSLSGAVTLAAAVMVDTGQNAPIDIRLLDADADGRGDILFRFRGGNTGTPAAPLDKWRLLKLTATGAPSVTTTTHVGTKLDQIADVDGDGLPDLVQCANGTYRVAFGNGVHFAPPTAALAGFTCNLASADSKRPLAIDLDRNGSSELIYPRDPSETPVAVLVASSNWLRGAAKTTPAIDIWSTDNQFLMPVTISVEGRNQTIYPRAADFNADGRADVLSAQNLDGGGVKLWRFTTNGMMYTQRVQQSALPLPNAIFADFNNDGYADVLAPNVGQNSATLTITNLGQTATLVAGAASEVMEPAFTAAGDFNGDGTPDIILRVRGSGGFKLFLTKSRPDLLNAVFEQPLVDSYRVDYSALSKRFDPTLLPEQENGVYTFNSGDCFSGLTCLRGGNGYVVRRLHRDAQSTRNDVTTYRYENAHVDSLGYGWLGFQRVYSRNALQGTQTTTEYYFGRETPSPNTHRFPFLGRPRIVTKRTAMGDGTTAVEQSYTNIATKVLTGNWFAFVTSKHQLKIMEAASGTQRTYASASHRVASINGVYQIDNFGNELDATDDFSSSTTRTVRTYQNTTANWIVKRPLSTTTTSCQSGECATLYSDQTWTAQGTERKARANLVSALTSGPATLTTLRERDLYGNVEETKLIDSLNNERVTLTLHEDSEHMYPTTEMNPAGHAIERRMHKFFALPTTVIGINRGLTQNAYDTFGRLVLTVRPDGVNETVTHTPLGPVTYADAFYAITKTVGTLPPVVTEYNRFDLPVRSLHTGFDGSQIERRRGYDARLRQTTETMPHVAGQPDGGSWETTYDALDAPTEQRQPDGMRVSHVLQRAPRINNVDREGVLTTTTNPRGYVQTQLTNAAGLVIETFDALQGQVIYTYGPFDRQRSMVDQHGNEFVATYDAYSRQIGFEDDDAGLISYSYTPFGEIFTETDATGNVATFGYDPISRRTSRSDSNGEQTRWDYDPLNGVGQLDFSLSPDGVRVAYTYDALGRLASETRTIASQVFTHDYTYDALGRLLLTTFPAATDGTRPAVWREYRNGMLAALHDNDTDAIYWARSRMNPRGQTSEEVYGNGATTTRTHYGWGGARTITTRDARGNVLQDLLYAYDANRNIFSREDFVQRRREFYVHDELDRTRSACLEDLQTPRPPPENTHVPSGYAVQAPLGVRISVEVGDPIASPLRAALPEGQVVGLMSIGTLVDGASPPGAQASYASCLTAEYDALGNISFRSDVGNYAYEPARPHAVSTITRGDGSSFSLEYDARGRLLKNDGQRIEWRPFSQPRMMQTAAGQSITFAYDANFGRAKKSGPSERFTYAGSDFYRREVLGTAASNIFMPAIETSSHYKLIADDRAVAELIVHDTNVLATSGQTYSDGTRLQQLNNSTGSIKGERSVRYLHDDHLGSVELMTEQSGLVSERRSYNFFGQPRPPELSASSRHIATTTRWVGYTGHEDDHELGTVNMRGRIYSPQLGRFLSPDAIVQTKLFSQALNPYSYVLNNPLKMTDPSGFAGELLWDFIAMYFNVANQTNQTSDAGLKTRTPNTTPELSGLELIPGVELAVSDQFLAATIGLTKPDVQPLELNYDPGARYRSLEFDINNRILTSTSWQNSEEKPFKLSREAFLTLMAGEAVRAAQHQLTLTDSTLETKKQIFSAGDTALFRASSYAESVGWAQNKPTMPFYVSVEGVEGVFYATDVNYIMQGMLHRAAGHSTTIMRLVNEVYTYQELARCRTPSETQWELRQAEQMIVWSTIGYHAYPTLLDQALRTRTEDRQRAGP
jgi:RHS repeat-associated protein